MVKVTTLFSETGITPMQRTMSWTRTTPMKMLTRETARPSPQSLALALRRQPLPRCSVMLLSVHLAKRNAPS